MIFRAAATVSTAKFGVFIEHGVASTPYLAAKYALEGALNGVVEAESEALDGENYDETGWEIIGFTVEGRKG